MLLPECVRRFTEQTGRRDQPSDASEMVENLQAALEQLSSIYAELEGQ